MTIETAKQHLLDWRPGHGPSSAEQAEALRLAQTDPQLAAWFAEHRGAQEEIRATLRSAPVPAGLKAAILRGTPGAAKIVRPGFVRWMALAASVALLITVASVYLRRDSDAGMAAFRSRMVGNALRNYRMDILTPDLGAIRAYLAQARWPSDYRLTPGLEKLPGVGCARLTWQSKPVAMICFARSGKADLYLFVADKNDVESSSRLKAAQVTKDRALLTATWSEGGKLYLLAGQGDELSFRDLLPKPL